jgi:cellobiose-specific phosphotransferase system component IIB
MENEADQNLLVRSRLDEAVKDSIKVQFDIDVDDVLLSPMVDYIFKRLFTADEKRSKIALIESRYLRAKL